MGMIIKSLLWIVVYHPMHKLSKDIKGYLTYLLKCMGHHLGIEVTIDVTKKMVHKDAEVSPQNKSMG
jgi:hypothetical protein